MSKIQEVVELGFSSSRKQFIENLEDRGIDTDYLFECECGHFHTADELVAVRSMYDETWYKYKCKACIGFGNEDRDCFSNEEKSVLGKCVEAIKKWI